MEDKTDPEEPHESGVESSNEASDATEFAEGDFEIPAHPFDDLDVHYANGHLQANLSFLLPHVEDMQARIASAQASQMELFAALLEEAMVEADLQKTPEDWGTDLKDGYLRLLRAEMAVALNMSEHQVSLLLNQAYRIVHNFAEVHTALSEGRIGLSHANIIADAGIVINDQDLRDQFADRMVMIAQTHTPTRTRRIAREIAEEYAAYSIDERHAEALKTRDVKVRALEGGLAEVTATLDAATAEAIVTRVTELAKHAQQDTDLFAGEVRANVFADLLLAGDPTVTATDALAIETKIRVTIPFMTLANLEPNPLLEGGAATLEGYGPIDTATARKLAAGARIWERVLTDPITGLVLAVDRYRPSESLRSLLDARDEHCRFPGCRRIATSCDLDHTHDWQHGGKTEVTNLSHLCRSHHSLKHAVFTNKTRWEVEQKPGGILEWKSPLGRKYVDRPVSTVRFKLRSEDPPPF